MNRDTPLSESCHPCPKNDTFTESSDSSPSNFRYRGPSVLHCTEEMVQNLTDFELETIKNRCKNELEFLPNFDPPKHWATPEVLNQIRNIKYFPDSHLNSLISKLMLRIGSFRQSVIATIVIFLSSESFKDFYLPNHILNESKGSKATRLPHPWYKLFHLFWQQFDLTPDLNSLFKKVINEACYKLSFVPNGEWKGKFLGSWTKSDRQVNPTAIYYPKHDEECENESSDDHGYEDGNSDGEGSLSSVSFEVLSDEDYVPPNNSVPPLDAVIKLKEKSQLEAETSNLSTSSPNENVNYLPGEFFTSEELAQIKARLDLELSFDHNDFNSVPWATSSTKQRIKQLNFFPDAELNSKMSQLLLKIHPYRTVVFSTMVVFYGLESYKSYYLPSQLDVLKNTTALKPPLPKYKLFHLFWQKIHGPGAAPLRFKRLVMTANYHLKRVPDGGWKGTIAAAHASVKHSLHLVKSPVKCTQKNFIRKIKQTKSTAASNVEYLHHHRHNSGGDSVPKLIPLSQWCNVSAQKNIVASNRSEYCAPQLVSLTESPSLNSFSPETGDYLRDVNGNAYIHSRNGNRLYIHVESLVNLSYDEFFKASRLIYMKARAYTLIRKVSPSNLTQDIHSLVSPMKYAPESTNKILHLSYFPDAKLNELITRLLFSEHSICKMVKWTASIFWCEEELKGTALIPSVVPFSRIHHEPLTGYLFFHQFWDIILGTRTSEERRKTLRSAITEIYREKCKKT